MKKITALLMLSLNLAAAQTPAPAAATAPDYSKVPSIYRNHYTLNADASYDQVYERTSIMRDQDDVQNGSVTALHFTAGLQSADVPEAYVLKPDGTKVPVSKSQITIKDAPQTNGFADFGDNKIIQVLFPSVAVGDKLYAKIHVKSKAIFPGRFSAYTESYPLGYPYQSTITIDAPQSLKLQGKARGEVSLTRQDKGERVVFTLTDGHATYKDGEPSSVSEGDYSGAGSVSNFAGWADMARAYRNRAADKATVTPEIKALATKVVGDKKGLDAVKAVDTWVRSNVRYVQVYLDAGGFVPHSAESILKNRYGDCKDYVTLSQAMLRAVGIDSEPVLVGTMPRYQEIPLAGPEQFDHAILYVPSLELYLDPTNRFAPVGAYQDGLIGKPVLHTATAGLRRFPASPENVVTEQVDMTLLPDGTVTGKLAARGTGTVSSDLRNALAGRSPEIYPQIVQNILAGYKETGTGTLSRAPEFSDFGPTDYAATWKSPKLVDMDTDDLIFLKMPRGATITSFDDLADGVALETRVTPKLTTAYTLHKVSTLTLPDGYKVTRLPKSKEGETATLKYAISYRQEGRKIIADQMMTIKKNVIAPAEYAAHRAGLQALVRAATGTILLEKQ